MAPGFRFPRVLHPRSPTNPPGGTGYRGAMMDMHTDDPSHLVVSGLVRRPDRYSLEDLVRLGEHRDGPTTAVVPMRRVIEGAGPEGSATHVTALSADGSYAASIPLGEAVSKGEIHVNEAAGTYLPIRLIVPEGMTLCWNVKGLGRLRVTEGPEPDSLPEVLTH